MKQDVETTRRCAEGCLHCSLCKVVNYEERREKSALLKSTTNLYDKELQYYYFYLLRNKAV